MYHPVNTVTRTYEWLASHPGASLEECTDALCAPLPSDGSVVVYRLFDNNRGATYEVVFWITAADYKTLSESEIGKVDMRYLLGSEFEAQMDVEWENFKGFLCDGYGRAVVVSDPAQMRDLIQKHDLVLGSYPPGIDETMEEIEQEAKQPKHAIICVTGGRDFTDKATLWKKLDELEEKDIILEVVHGDCRGADKFAGEWAQEHGINNTKIRADWKKHGKSAGPIRNGEMIYYLRNRGHKVIVVVCPGGKGTDDMRGRARKVEDFEVVEV
jgi:hypothetical protein